MNSPLLLVWFTMLALHFSFPDVRVLCLLLQGEGERLDLLLGDDEVECPDDGGGYSGGLCVFCPLGVWRSVPACPLLCLSS